MTAPSDALLDIQEREIEIDGEPRLVLVAHPAVEVRLDAERLERMRKGDFVSRVDLEILQAVAQRGGRVAVVIFDAAKGSENASWAFEPDLEDEQRMELGLRLLRSQLSLYRELIRMKAGGLIGVGFGSMELAAFQRGTVRIVSELTEELETAEPERAAQIEIDLWLIEHAAVWTGLPREGYFQDRLATEIAERDAKRSEIEALLAKATTS